MFLGFGPVRCRRAAPAAPGGIRAETEIVTATCVDESSLGGFIECTYIIDDPDGAFEITSTATLISEFGFLGVVIDPLIVQIPARRQRRRVHHAE